MTEEKQMMMWGAAMVLIVMGFMTSTLIAPGCAEPASGIIAHEIDAGVIGTMDIVGIVLEDSAAERIVKAKEEDEEEEFGRLVAAELDRYGINEPVVVLWGRRGGRAYVVLQR